MKNKYWKKLCTPEQNRNQTGALILLASSLTIMFLAWLIFGK
jgi:hypothetical protein